MIDITGQDAKVVLMQEPCFTIELAGTNEPVVLHIDRQMLVKLRERIEEALRLHPATT
jgi:hypothetical protein